MVQLEGILRIARLSRVELREEEEVSHELAVVDDVAAATAANLGESKVSQSGGVAAHNMKSARAMFCICVCICVCVCVCFSLSASLCFSLSPSFSLSRSLALSRSRTLSLCSTLSLYSTRSSSLSSLLSLLSSLCSPSSLSARRVSHLLSAHLPPAHPLTCTTPLGDGSAVMRRRVRRVRRSCTDTAACSNARRVGPGPSPAPVHPV